jgi:hypothetical protein
LNNKKSKDIHDKVAKEERKKIRKDYLLSAAYAADDHSMNQLQKGIKIKQSGIKNHSDKSDNDNNESLKLSESKINKKTRSES